MGLLARPRGLAAWFGPPRGPSARPASGLPGPRRGRDARRAGSERGSAPNRPLRPRWPLPRSRSPHPGGRSGPRSDSSSGRAPRHHWPPAPGGAPARDRGCAGRPRARTPVPARGCRDGGGSAVGHSRGRSSGRGRQPRSGRSPSARGGCHRGRRHWPPPTRGAGDRSSRDGQTPAAGATCDSGTRRARATTAAGRSSGGGWRGRGPVGRRGRRRDGRAEGEVDDVARHPDQRERGHQRQGRKHAA